MLKLSDAGVENRRIEKEDYKACMT